MNKMTVYGLSGKDGLVDTVLKLASQGLEVCIHGTHKIGINNYMIQYEGEVDKAIDEVNEKDASEPDWNLVDSFTRKQEIADYAKSEFDLDISTELKMKEMVAEFKSFFS